MEKDNNVPEKQKQTAKSVLVIIGNIVFYIVIAALFLFSLMNINAGSKDKGFPNIFGRGYLNVLSNSMEREDTYAPEEWKNYDIQEIKKDDLVFVKKLTEKDFESLKVGDVIVFYYEPLKALNSHRIVHIGNGYVLTQGDRIVSQGVDGKNYYWDEFSEDANYHNFVLESNNGSDEKYYQWVNSEDIKGIVTSVASGKGKIAVNLRDNWLFYFVIPVAIVLIIELFFVFKNILDLRNEKAKVAMADDKEAMLADLAAEKERMRQELLAELKAAQAAETSTQEAKPAEEPKVEDAPVIEAPESNASTEEVVEEKENTEE